VPLSQIFDIGVYLFESVFDEFDVFDKFNEFDVIDELFLILALNRVEYNVIKVYNDYCVIS